jgi:ferredoxin--NADP+ reductase
MSVTFSQVPHMVGKPKNPFQCRVVSNERLVAEGNADDIHHVVFEFIGDDIKFFDGQSFGIIPSGNAPDGKHYKVRLYSLASPRHGEDGNESHFALCVKRVVYEDAEGHAHFGIASNYICDLKADDIVDVTGPAGKRFILPVENTANIIMLGVGTGIAPFRGFIKHMLQEEKDWAGKIRLFFGAKYDTDALYMNKVNNELEALDAHGIDIKLFQALSRQDPKIDGKKVYVQTRLEQQMEEIWPMLVEGEVSIYICGLKGMEAGIQEVLEKHAEKNGMVWSDMLHDLKHLQKWHVEVY